MRVVHHVLDEIVEMCHVVSRYQLIWVVRRVVGHELCLSSTEPVLEAGLTERMPTIRQSDRRASIDSERIDG